MVPESFDVQAPQILELPGCSGCLNHDCAAAFLNIQGVSEVLRSTHPEHPWHPGMASIPRRSGTLSIQSIPGGGVLWISGHPRHLDIPDEYCYNYYMSIPIKILRIRESRPALVYVAESERDAERLRGQVDAPVQVHRQSYQTSGLWVAETTQVPEAPESPTADRASTL